MMNQINDTIVAPVSGVCSEVSDRVEQAIDKTDQLVTNRLMRLANHGAVLFTLKALADKAGMTISLENMQLDAAADSFVGLTGDLEIAGWLYNIWAVCAVLQLCSVLRSALAEKKDELTQADITSMAVTNFFVARMVGSSNVLRDTVLAAVVSGHAVRNNLGASSGGYKVSLHTAPVQLASAFLTITATLGVVAALAGQLYRVPVIGDYLPDALGPFLAVVAMHGITNNEGNGTIKEIVNGAVLIGAAFNALSRGVDLSLDVSSILGNAVLAAQLYVTYNAFDNAKNAIQSL